MEFLLIFIFGILGGISRLWISNSISYESFPYMILVINLLGTFALPIWNNFLGQKVNQKLKIAIGTGFIGSFTTFSGITIDLIKFMQASNYLSALIYLTITIIFGFILSIIGNNLSEDLINQGDIK
ncbi:fluoride efflux transporter CrcB [Lactobacillus sp. S2-2]|uniref:FluC/FEX family fluoride channel n=1 Tax=Lactobacillus sp. S2-2 TaxID=2692917 RepID=UPI001F1A6C1E|nr:CrcB family protein [Lactobacillus sp. S2-2]MCF6515312.1 fluoride efflux transporter CrcB [Lactobacillus sp. S2-2]